MTLLATDMIAFGVARFGKRIAVRFGDDALTFKDVDALSGRMASTLAADLAPGAAVGLLTNNSLFSVPLDFACLKARLMRVPLNARLSAIEQARMLGGLGVQTLVYSDDLAERADELAHALPGLATVALSALIADSASSDAAFVRAPQPDDIVLALYTSGTSGNLKAAQHSQSSFAAITLNVLGNLIDPRPGDTILHAASLIHASGTLVLPLWMRGGTSAILPGFAPDAYLDAVERRRPKMAMLVPTMLTMLFDAPNFSPGRLASIDTIIYGASPMPRPLIERGLALLGPRFVQFFGQTEAPLAIAVLTREDHLDPGLLGTCGRPARECEMRIVDPDGIDLPTGEEGEVVVRTPCRMIGYHDAEALNSETMLPGGWLRTRDIGRLDARGYLTLMDRASDMIISGGYNIYPKEVEDALLTHPGVAEAVVVGVPSDTWGEAVAAFVVPRGIAPDPAELTGHCRKLLAGYKVPKQMTLIAEVPKSAVGKPLRRAIRDPFWVGRERRI